MRQIKRIFIHCSATPFGNLEYITQLHQARGFRTCGYHLIIGNCYPTEESWLNRTPFFSNDGRVEYGRPFSEQGAHAQGHNEDSIGICLIGAPEKGKDGLPLNVGPPITSAQWRSLLREIEKIFDLYDELEIVMHYEVDKHGKTCPNLSGDYIRQKIEDFFATPQPIPISEDVD